MARKNKVDESKKAEQAKAEKLNQSQGVEISTIIVVLSFRLQQCGFHYRKGYKSFDTLRFRFCRAYEKGFITMLTTLIFLALLRFRLWLSTPSPTQSSTSSPSPTPIQTPTPTPSPVPTSSPTPTPTPLSRSKRLVS